MSEASPIQLRAYTPEEVYEARWLGDITPDAMRKAVQREDWPCTRLRRKIHFTAENIAAILAKAQENAEETSTSAAQPPRRGRRPKPDLSVVSHGEPPLKADPGRARRRRKAS